MLHLTLFLCILKLVILGLAHHYDVNYLKLSNQRTYQNFIPSLFYYFITIYFYPSRPLKILLCRSALEKSTKTKE